jgi:type IV pilus assembly protein PilC
MAVFIYKAIDKEGQPKNGTVEAVNVDVAITSLQRRGFIISSINEVNQKGGFFNKNFTFLEKVSNKDIVILSRQLATLFSAQVSALRIFRLLGAETENPKLARHLDDIAENLQGGNLISVSMEKHKDVFSNFYISMVRAGEETGKLNETFVFLADYLDRAYGVTQKAKNALIYPAFIVFTFISVMILMLTVVIPKISKILLESGQAIPPYTKVVIAMSDLLVNYGFFFLAAVVIGVIFFIRFIKTDSGKARFDGIKLQVPYLGSLYSKLYLSRVADNLNTMLGSGISMVKALELTCDVVDNKVFLKAIQDSLEDVKAGAPISVAFEKHPQFPNILIQMMRVGEETGNLGEILATLAKFYQREVTNAVDTLVGLIEPVMIIMLAVGVGTLLASVLVPIYNISSAF